MKDLEKGHELAYVKSSCNSKTADKLKDQRNRQVLYHGSDPIYVEVAGNSYCLRFQSPAITDCAHGGNGHEISDTP